jgi:hypothetical protein
MSERSPVTVAELVEVLQRLPAGCVLTRWSINSEVDTLHEHARQTGHFVVDLRIEWPRNSMVVSPGYPADI